MPENIFGTTMFPGKPPHVGWWLTLDSMGVKLWRWHDGVKWSMPVVDSVTPALAGWCAGNYTSLKNNFSIRWCWYWPKHARVPRINPATGEVTGGQAA